MNCDNCPNDVKKIHEYEAGNVTLGIWTYWLCDDCIAEEKAAIKKIMFFRPTGNSRG